MRVCQPCNDIFRCERLQRAPTAYLTEYKGNAKYSDQCTRRACLIAGTVPPITTRASGTPRIPIVRERFQITPGWVPAVIAQQQVFINLQEPENCRMKHLWQVVRVVRQIRVPEGSDTRALQHIAWLNCSATRVLACSKRLRQKYEVRPPQSNVNCKIVQVVQILALIPIIAIQFHYLLARAVR